MSNLQPMLEDSDINYRDTQVYYLRMDQRPNYNPKCTKPIDIQLLPKPIDPKYYLELYQGVGLVYDWVDRLLISEAELAKLLNRDEVEVFLFLCDEDPCGYTEFVRNVDFVEILYFGLFPEYTGRGFGSAALKQAVNQAWSYDPERVELNTCDLDNEQALEVYQRVGFQEYQTKIEKRRTIF